MQPHGPLPLTALKSSFAYINTTTITAKIASSAPTGTCTSAPSSCRSARKSSPPQTTIKDEIESIEGMQPPLPVFRDGRAGPELDNLVVPQSEKISLRDILLLRRLRIREHPWLSLRRMLIGLCGLLEVATVEALGLVTSSNPSLVAATSSSNAPPLSTANIVVTMEYYLVGGGYTKDTQASS
jgi:hypothetical protein